MSQIASYAVTLASGQRVVLRHAVPGDAEQLAQLDNAIIEEDIFGVTAPGEKSFTRAEEIARIERSLADPNGLRLVADMNGLIVGELDCSGRDRQRLAHTVNFGISIASGYRDQGIGRILISTLLDWATAHPTIEKVTLGVLAANERAIHLYRSLGFKEEGRRYRFLKYADGSYSDDILI